MKVKNKIKNIFTLSSVFLVTTGIFTSFAVTNVQGSLADITKKAGLFKNVAKIEQANSKVTKKVTSSKNNSDYLFLSDLDYITENNWSYNGWSGHTLQKNANPEGGVIRLIINGTERPFVKGLGIHAKGQVTYDISGYSNKYTRFIAKIGLNADRPNPAKIYFIIYASNDGESWKELLKTPDILPKQEAIDVDLNIEGYKYLRIYVDPVGSNTSDHGVVASPKLVTADYVEEEYKDYDKVHPVSYYDNIISQHNVEYNYTNNYRLILEREFVNKMGYDVINSIANSDKKGRDVLEWILSDNTILEQIIEVGQISNTTKFLTILSEIYDQYSDDINSEENGLMYTKIAVAIGAAYTTDAYHSSLQFGQYGATYNYVTRFGTYKKLYEENLLMRMPNTERTGNFVKNEWFKNLHVDLMRIIMNEAMPDEEILWLNGYTHYKKSLSEYMVPYVSPNYNQAKLYSEENREKYTKEYLLDEYNIPYGVAGVKRYWMVIAAGGICWNESRFGQSMYRVNGLPAVGAYQPGHEMYFNYHEDGNGNGFWVERYGGYSSAGTTWGGGSRYRLIFDWGNKSFADQNISGSKGGTSLGYLYLAQANLNNYSKYKKSVYYNLVANSYSEDKKKIETYYAALEVNPTNLDSHDAILKLYQANKDGNITTDDWYKLALNVTDSYKYYPVAMYDLLKVIRPNLDNGIDRLNIDRIEKENLTTAKNVSNDTLASIGAVNAGSGVRTHATQFLGLTQPDPVSFSFDGENGKKLVKHPNYSFNWAYSLDGGHTYSEYTIADSVTLTKEEIASITDENDIKIKFMGLNDYVFTINITTSTLPTNLFANDLENKVMGTTNIFEWRLQGDEEWNSLAEQTPDLTGNKVVEMRVGYTKTNLPSNSTTFTFTDDNQPNTRKYVPIKHLSVHSYISQSKDTNRPFYAPNAIDGDLNTMWHTDFNIDVRNSSTKPYYIVKLDKPRNISAVEFIQQQYKKNNPDYIKDAIVYVSVDGESWVEAGRIVNCPQVNQLRSINFENSVYGQYIKFEMVTHSMFTSLAMLNIFEDISVRTIGTFTFDGENAESIIITDEFKSKEWKYSLDGGNTWKNGSGDVHKLSTSELNEINDINKIILSVPSEDVRYTINIGKKNKPTIPSNVYKNDLENRLIGLTDINDLEWKINEGKWSSYAESEPIVTGNSTLYLRTKASGAAIASDYVTFDFTDDNQPDNAKYIPIKHLSIHGFSSETVRTGNQEQATNAIDGNINTKWHSSRTAVNDEKWISIKLDEPRYISKIEYNKENGYTYGVPKNGKVYTSMDGETWEEVLNFTNLYNPTTKAELAADVNKKDIILEDSVLAQYIKIQVITACDYVNGSTNGVPHNYFFSATMLNLFEDTTKKLPEQSIEYSINTKTNQNVIATITPSDKITITNNDGNPSYTFTENGHFVFEYTDANGTAKTITANVDWIDKDAPIGTIKYSSTDRTNQNIIVTLETNEPVTITNNNGENTYTFTENGEFTFEFVDEAGNAGTATAIVDLIDKDAPNAEIEYSTTNKTNKDVVATIIVDEDVTITNNKGSKTYTFTDNGEFVFEYRDQAGNTGSITAKVTWIDRTIPTAVIIYSPFTKTNQNVTATLQANEKIKVLNNDGKEAHIFTDNGEFTFEFEDEAGNIATAIAKVDWIDKTAPVGTIIYSTKNFTKEDVLVSLETNEKVTITNNGGNNTYTFTDNGEFTFEFVDEVGNVGSATAKVTWIDRTAPVGTITYSTKNITNGNVIATLTADEEIIITNNNGENTYTFDDNGEFTFEFEDQAGNTSTATAKVDWINKDAPIATIKYNITDKTNKDVVATIVVDEDVTITNNNGKNTYTFTKNGEFTFEFTNKSGVKGTATAKVNWIDKTTPTATIEYNITTETDKEVIATLNPSEKITITNNNGKDSYTFTENGEFTFEFVDEAGNTGSATAIVNWIKFTELEVNIEYDVTNSTTGKVVATVKSNRTISITNNDGKDSYTFTKNGEFTFEYIDAYGKTGTITAKVDWIEEVELEVSVEYDITTITGGKVIATIKSNKPITITNNDGKKTYTFTENGEFTFEYIDDEGNKGSIKAIVDWIDESAPTAEVEYSIVEFTNKDVVVKLVNPSTEITITNNDGKDTYTFTKNGEFTFEYVDANGRKGSTKAKVNWIDKEVAEVELAYNITSYTNKDVTVTLMSNEEITITNNNGKNTYKFTKNGEFTFEYTDKYGNKGQAKAVVKWIDKTAIIATIKYSITTKTNKNVIATLQTNKEVKVINNNGKKTYTFTKNGEFTFEYEDKYGNTGKTTAKVNWIDKTIKTNTNVNSNSNKPITSNNNSNSNISSNSNSNNPIESNSNELSNSNIESNSNEFSNKESNTINESNSNNNVKKDNKNSNKTLSIAVTGILLLLIGFVAFKVQKKVSK